MTTDQYTRTVQKFAFLHHVGMSIADYIAQLDLFTPELNDEQLCLLRKLEARGPRRDAPAPQPSLFD